MVTLGELIAPAKVRRAGTDEYPLLSMTMHNGLVPQNAKFTKRVASTDTSGYKVVKRGQLVVGFPIDEGVLDFQTQHEEAIVSPAYGVWNLKNGPAVHIPYLKRFLRSNAAIAYYAAKLRGSTARRRSLPAPIFLELQVPLPPLDEQRRIAAILDQAQNQLDNTRKAKSLLGALPRSIFQKMFSERTTNVVQLGELITDHQLGLDKKSSELGPDGAHPYLKMDSVTRTGDLDLTRATRADCSEDEARKFSLRDGDLIFNTRNARNLVGKSTVYRGPFTLFNNNILRLRFGDKVHPDFVHQFLWSELGRQQLESRKSGTTSVWAIYYKSLKTIEVPVPDFNDQLLFTQQLTMIRERAHKHRQRELAMEALVDSLQSRAFRGEL